MVPGRPAVDVCIEGNICDSTARVAADIVEDGTPVFVVQQLFDPAKDQRAEFDRPKTGEYNPDDPACLDPERNLEERHVGICAGGVIGTGWR